MSSIAVAISTISRICCPPKAKYAKSVTIGRTLLPPPWIRCAEMSVRSRSLEPIARTRFSSTSCSSWVTQLNGSLAPCSKGILRSTSGAALESGGDELIFVSWIRDTPRADRKARPENGIDHQIGQVEYGEVTIASRSSSRKPENDALDDGKTRCPLKSRRFFLDKNEAPRIYKRPRPDCFIR